MQDNSNSPWRSPASEYPPKHQSYLRGTVSVVDLREPESTWYHRRSPSPTASSVSSYTSRSTTPTTSNNPWSSVMTSPTSTVSTKSSSSSPKDSPNRTPQYTSRSTTPVAPQPLRPIHPSTGFVPMSPTPSSSGEGFRVMDYPGSPIQNFPGSPNPYRQAPVSVSPLVNGFLNRALLSSQGTSLSGWFYNLSRQQGWETSMANNVWHWTVSNPRLALLLVVCDDVASWRQAKFFDLRDENLPFPEDRLQGIVANPRKVVEEQWRATSKELPLNGSHIDFAPRETVPMQHISLVRTSRSSEKSVDRVRMLGNNEDQILIRKRFVITRPTQKVTLLKQINDFKQFDHKNIAKLLCSYSQPSHIGIAMARAQYTLDDFLCLPSGDSIRSKLLLDWMHDLSHALEYLHSQSICHRSVRPRKILIDGARVYFGPFGIGQSSDIFSPTVANSQRLDQLHSYFQDQSYIYAAPEAITSRGKRPADVFSLGCVFISMMTVVQNHSPSLFTQYRAGSSQDASFHAHLDRVGSWRTRLYATATSGLRNGIIGPGRKQLQLKSEGDWLQIIGKMILAEPKERIKMARLTAILAKLGDGRATGGRRRSLDAGGFSGQTAAALGTVTGSNNTNINGGESSISSGVLNSRGNNNGSNEPPMSVVTGNVERQPELSLFNHYFQQQQEQRQQQQYEKQRQQQQQRYTSGTDWSTAKAYIQ